MVRQCPRLPRSLRAASGDHLGMLQCSRPKPETQIPAVARTISGGTAESASTELAQHLCRPLRFHIPHADGFMAAIGRGISPAQPLAVVPGIIAAFDRSRDCLRRSDRWIASSAFGRMDGGYGRQLRIRKNNGVPAWRAFVQHICRLFFFVRVKIHFKKMFSSKYVNSPISTRRLILFTIVYFVSTFIILYLSWIFIGPVSIDIISFSFFEYEHDNLREVIDEFLVVRNLTMGDGADIFSYGFSDLRSTFRSYFSVDDPTGIYGVFVISSFFTSIWVWLFVVGAIAARITSMIGTAIGVGSRHFHFVSFLARHPLRLVGYSLMICVGAFSLILRASSALPSGDTDQTGAFRPPHWVVMSSVRSSAGRQGCGRMPADMAQIDPSALHDLSRCPRFPNEPNSEKGPTLS